MDKLGFFERAVKVVDKYGGWKVFQSIMFVGMFLFFIYYIPIITKSTVQQTTIEAMHTVNKDKEEMHIQNLEQRRQLQPKVDAILESFLTSAKADRAFIIELHNGSNNLNGVPFLHGSVTYDASVDGLDGIDEEYQNISLSRFEMSTYLHKNFEFIGTIDEMSKIDKKLAAKLKSNDVKYIAITTLHNGTNEWGWFGVLYNRTTDIPSEKDLLNQMLINAQSITKELDLIKKGNE